MPAKRGLAQRFDSKNHVDILHQPRPEERAPKSGLPDFGNLKVSKSATADFDARVSKDGHRRDRARGHPSRRPREARGLLRMRSEGHSRAPDAPGSHNPAARDPCGAIL